MQLKRMEVFYTDIFPELPPNLQELSLFKRPHRYRFVETLNVGNVGNITQFELGGITQFELGGMYSQDEINSILLQLPASLQHLRILSHGIDCNTCPVFPNVTELYLFVGHSLGDVNGIQDKFPSLRELFLSANDYCGVSRLEGLRGVKLTKLTIQSKKLKDLGPLQNATIQELDVTRCPNIVDFSHVRHVPLLKKISTT
jgi:hypothetical protein